MQYLTDMDKEYKALINLCKNYINNNAFIFDTSVDYKKIYRYAKVHNLLGIVNCAVANAENKNDISPKFKNAVENSFFDLIYLANLQSNMLKEVKTLLRCRISCLKAQCLNRATLCLKVALWAI